MEEPTPVEPEPAPTEPVDPAAEPDPAEAPAEENGGDDDGEAAE